MGAIGLYWVYRKLKRKDDSGGEIERRQAATGHGFRITGAAGAADGYNRYEL
jgi:hypothetical protein